MAVNLENFGAFNPAILARKYYISDPRGYARFILDRMGMKGLDNMTIEANMNYFQQEWEPTRILSFEVYKQDGSVLNRSGTFTLSWTNGFEGIQWSEQSLGDSWISTALDITIVHVFKEVIDRRIEELSDIILD